MVVTAHLRGAFAPGLHPVHMDALLCAELAARTGAPPVEPGQDPAPMDLPLARAECGRVWLASAAIFAAECHETRWLQRRFPVGPAQDIGGPKVGRINPANGATKSKRAPVEVCHVVDDRVMWLAVGNADAVLDLVRGVDCIGRLRGHGYGAVREWSVDEHTDPWPGFPVLDAGGAPLRTLPADWPGLLSGAGVRDRQPVVPPYWHDRVRRSVAVVVPAR